MRRWLVAIVLAVATSSCLWRGYATILDVHLDVLTQTAAKLVTVVESGRGLSAESMAEYVYPAKRAREFLRQFSSNSQRPSYQKLGSFLDRYEAMVNGVDATRAAAGGDQKAQAWDRIALAAERDALFKLAGEIRADASAGH